MRVISLWEPWASLWCSGVKVHETRHWSTSYRGPLVVHAAKRWTRASCEDVRDLWPAIEKAGLAERFGRLGAGKLGPDSLGSIVGMVNLDACLSTDRHTPSTELDELCGNWGPGRFAWRAENPVLLKEPVPCRGAQGFWEVPDSLLSALGLSSAGGEKP